MKVVLKTLVEFQASSVFMQAENQLCIGFTEISSYDELKASLTEEAMQEVKIYTGETTFEEYNDFTQFAKATVVTTENGTQDIAMYFNRADELTRKIAILQDTVDKLVLESLEG
ncbi:MAG: hypothetical protein K0R69_2804 [Clostridia bacterium]|jgi:hypothetical protein|nr:hypothetical protein [Clostridia bacterium]